MEISVESMEIAILKWHVLQNIAKMSVYIFFSTIRVTNI